MLRFTLACVLFLSMTAGTVSRAEEPRGANRAITRIVFSGLAGAILGLSTLSFYGRPQDKLNNIGLGFAVGAIGGTIYSTYRAAAEPREFYGLREGPEPMALLENPRFQRVADLRPLNFEFSF